MNFFKKNQDYKQIGKQDLNCLQRFDTAVVCKELTLISRDTGRMMHVILIVNPIWLKFNLSTSKFGVRSNRV